MERFDAKSFQQICDRLSVIDKDLKNVITQFGYPVIWGRGNSFENLVLTILEQQVSLASAYAAFKKLKGKMKSVLPEAFLQLSDDELRACFFSRQKIIYARELARALVAKKISLRKLYHQPDETVRTELKKLKGIGDWTVDIYLLHSLKRMDIFPIGDLALVNSIKMIKQLPSATKEELLTVTTPWKPYRSIAAIILWHYYIVKKNINLSSR